MLKILIKDYIADKSDTRLEILCCNVNPDFKLGKKNRTQLDTLISDYEKDGSTGRLKIIKSFLGGATASPKSLKKVKATFRNVNTVDDEYITIQNEMTELNRQIVAAKGDKMVLSALQPIYAGLSSKLDIAIRIRDKKTMENLDPVRLEKDMIVKLFGDVNDVNTFGFKILNGIANDFRIQMPYDPTVMIKKLFAHNGKEPYEYTAGLIDPQNRVWRVTKGAGLVSYDQGTKGI